MLDQDELLIVQGLRRGQADAWTALYDAHAERVWRGVARLLGAGSADVADVVQETFLAAARSAATFDPACGRLWPWLWGIARRHVALHYRKENQRHRLRQAAEAWAAAGNGRPTPPDVHAALENAERLLLVRVTLAELSDDYEMLLTAHYLDGETVEQIAARERNTESAVRSRLARARQAFKHAFSRYLEPTAGRGALAP